jgi:hypothetical protein
MQSTTSYLTNGTTLNPLFLAHMRQPATWPRPAAASWNTEHSISVPCQTSCQVPPPLYPLQPCDLCWLACTTHACAELAAPADHSLCKAPSSHPLHLSSSSRPLTPPSQVYMVQPAPASQGRASGSHSRQATDTGRGKARKVHPVCPTKTGTHKKTFNTPSSMSSRTAPQAGPCQQHASLRAQANMLLQCSPLVTAQSHTAQPRTQANKLIPLQPYSFIARLTSTAAFRSTMHPCTAHTTDPSPSKMQHTQLTATTVWKQR